MATGVWSWDATAANNANADASINWAEGQAPSTINDSARSEMAGMAKYLLDTHGALTTTGAANTYSVTTNSTIAALRDGLGISVVVNASSTGASTLNVDALGAKKIRKITNSGEEAIGADELRVNGHYILNYDASADGAAGAWILLNPTPTAASFLADVVDDTTPQLGGMLDVNGQSIGDGATELLTFVEDASAVNNVEIENQATGSGPIIRAVGDDLNIDLVIGGKGTGRLKNASGDNYLVDGEASVADGSITTAKLADGAVTTAKMTAPTLVSLEGLTLAQGDILYASAADTVARLAKGTAAQALVMNSGATAPEWVDSGGGGGWEVIETYDHSVDGTVADVSFETDITNYSEFEILLHDLGPSSNAQFVVEMGVGDPTITYTEATSLYISTGWDGLSIDNTTLAGSSSFRSSAVSNSASRAMGGVYRITAANLAETSIIQMQIGFGDSGGNKNFETKIAGQPTAAVITGIKCRFNGQNIARGIIQLRGRV